MNLTLAPRILSFIPSGWQLSHIIITNHPAKGREVNADHYIWQVNLISDEFIIVASGETLEAALGLAAERTADPTTFGKPLYRVSDHRAPDTPRPDLMTLVSMRAAKSKPKFDRRGF